MAGPLLLIPALQWGAAAAGGLFLYFAGSRVIEDVDTLGDVAVAAAVGVGTKALTGSTGAGLLASASTLAVIYANKEANQ